MQLFILIGVLIVSAMALAGTPLGRSVYAIGNNETAARFAGLGVGRIKLLMYSFSGFMAGVAGFIFTSRVTSTRADAATGLELDVIAAVVFGGTSIFGGRGTILGTAHWCGDNPVAQKRFAARRIARRVDRDIDRYRSHSFHFAESVFGEATPHRTWLRQIKPKPKSIMYQTPQT